jgi:hypothetical protein
MNWKKAIKVKVLVTLTETEEKSLKGKEDLLSILRIESESKQVLLPSESQIVDEIDKALELGSRSLINGSVHKNCKRSEVKDLIQ